MRPNRSKDLDTIMSKLEGHLQQSMKGPSHSASLSSNASAASQVPSKVPPSHPYYRLMRNHELFLHDLRIGKASKDEEIDDMFLSGLG